MDDEIPASSFIRIGQSLEMPGEIDVEQECIDCITDWITQYIGESRMSYENGSGRIYHESSPIKTIRDLVTQNIKGLVIQFKRYGSTEERRNSYKKLLDTYYSLDYDVMTQQWQEQVTRHIIVDKKKDGFDKYERYDYGRQGSVLDDWKSKIVMMATYQNNDEDIGRFLRRHSTHGTKFTWGRENENYNNIIRKYLKCYLDLYLAVFPEYSNIQPEFIIKNFPFGAYGGSKIKNKNKKTKKCKINKIKKNKTNKTNRIKWRFK
jgi:effector-binding domain-containing protein